MPRSIQPGGLLRQMHVRYTARRKLGLLTTVERLQHVEGLTLRRAAECHFCSPFAHCEVEEAVRCW